MSGKFFLLVVFYKMSDMSKREVQISKALSYLLRHGAHKEKLPMTDDGWIKIDDLLHHQRLKSFKTTRDDLNKIVLNNDKQRFKIKNEFICAVQGHSIKINNDNLVKLDENELPSEIYHGTYQKKLPMIKASGGLSKMNRNHIHFTSPGAKSGIRPNCNLLIYLDIRKCLQNKIVFYKSENGVILTEGIDGLIPANLWLKVVQLPSHEEAQ